MSQITVSGNASGTGIFTIASPATNTNRTLTLPDSTGTIATAESTLTQFNASGSAPVYACRAWVNFNGTGTVAIRASGNVSSITDQGVGVYAINFATAMIDASYSYSHAYSNEANGQHTVGFLNIMSTTALSVAHYNAANSAQTVDKSFVLISVFR